MKFTLTLALISICLGCRTTLPNIKCQSNISVDSIFEKFDTAAYYKRKAGDYTRLDGFQITASVAETFRYNPVGDIFSIYEWQTPPLPYYYTIYKKYYPNCNIKEKGKLMFGGDSDSRIGTWYYFSEDGKLIKTVNESAKFKSIDYDALLTILKSEGVIDLRTGKNRKDLNIFFSEANGWHVKVYTKLTYKKDNYGQMVIVKKVGYKYEIDSNSGKIITKIKLFEMPENNYYLSTYIIKDGKRYHEPKKR